MWNLATKRPRALWKAHDGYILTLKATSMGLLSHGRDSNIRIWDLSPDSIKFCSSETSKMDKEVTIPRFEEIPVNALNFCNVDLWEMKNTSEEITALLATTASVNSDNFDVYKVTKSKRDLSVLRIIENFSVKSVEPEKYPIEEVNSPELALSLRGHGIVMRLLFAAENTLFVAYESGAVFGLKLVLRLRESLKKSDRLIVNNDVKVVPIMAVLGRSLQPVLALEYDGNGTLYCGSASKKLLQIDISKLTKNFGSLIVKDTLALDLKKDPAPRPLNSPELKLSKTMIGSKSETLSNAENRASANEPLPKINKLDLKPPKHKTNLSNNNSLWLFDDIKDQTEAENPIFPRYTETYTNLKHYGIQNLQITKTGFVAAFWDGTVEVYERYKSILVLERAEEAIQPSQAQKGSRKSLCIYCWTKSTNELAKRSKSCFHSFINDSLLYAGYSDGLIRAYAL